MNPVLPIIGVVGLGAMGLGIAQVFAQAGFTVLATDADKVARDRSIAAIDSALSARVSAGKLSTAEKASALRHVEIVSSLVGLSSAGLVVEAIAEKLDVKRGLFEQLESIVAEDAVLATNTSSLSVRAIAGGLLHPERVVGMHFFNPAPAMRLVELIGHAGTNANSLGRARTAAAAAGKTVVSCPDSPGFIVNRCARPYYGEALAMFEEGRTASDIDAATLAAGYRIGPFSLIDLIGADINLAASVGMFEAFERHPRYHVFDTLRVQVAKGGLGKKTGLGFLFPEQPGSPPPDADAVVGRIEALLVNEACGLLGSGGVTAEGIDTALKLGLNFPRGPFEILRARGAAKILKVLDDLESRAPDYLRGRYTPSPALTEVA